ncbi:MAG TPA: response regulator, partial [Chitinophagaceae bacterium]
VQKVNMFEAELKEGNFNLLIIDMLLSGTDGKEICKAIKQHSETKDIPVIMISAHPSAKEICLSAGADDFISKPFDMHEFVSKVNKLINIRPKRGEA